VQATEQGAWHAAVYSHHVVASTEYTSRHQHHLQLSKLKFVKRTLHSSIL